MHNALLIASSFGASAVEAVEALTIVLAVGVTRGWKAAFLGIVCASIALVLIVGVLGASLVEFVPLNVLRVVVGVLLLIFGMQWMRKAVLRASDLKSKHDEAAIFQAEVSGLRADGPAAVEGFDWTGFVVSFKGVFLEGLEVAFIVVTFGANSGRIDLAAAGAIAAVAAVSVVGLVVHAPLTRVPENAIKFVVAVMLMSFGTFWGGEGVGVEWTLKEPTILIIAALYWAAATLFVAALKQRRHAALTPVADGGTSV